MYTYAACTGASAGAGAGAGGGAGAGVFVVGAVAGGFEGVVCGIRVKWFENKKASN